ncbi:MAG: hypothetical protein E6929_04645 [Clostridium sp.]|nr:hypothetical protein [Clostridium sp.]
MINKQYAEGIILFNNVAVFQVNNINGKEEHSFIKVETDKEGSAEEVILSCIKSITEMECNILFSISSTVRKNHRPFLIELHSDNLSEKNIIDKLEELTNIELISLENLSKYNDIDKLYFEALMIECNSKKYFPNWYYKIKNIVER